MTTGFGYVVRRVGAGVTEVGFTAGCSAGAVPGVVWMPVGSTAAPVVMLGHGGSGSKRSARSERLGGWFARRGVVAVAIDGPYHGDRVPTPIAAAEYQRRMVKDGVEAVIQAMVDDWTTALTALADRQVVDDSRCAYLGLSLGSRFGIPLAAALGPSLRCAVFGKFGLMQSASMPPGLNTPDLIRDAAARITAPTMLHVQWDDHLFPRQGAFELFEAFGAAEKVLVMRPGPHTASHPNDEPTWRSFILHYLAE